MPGYTSIVYNYVRELNPRNVVNTKALSADNFPQELGEYYQIRLRVSLISSAESFKTNNSWARYITHYIVCCLYHITHSCILSQGDNYNKYLLGHAILPLKRRKLYCVALNSLSIIFFNITQIQFNT